MAMIAQSILPAARLTRGYAEKLLEGVSAERFARTPQGVRTNHPAWVYGHLSMYPDMMLGVIGRPDLAKPRLEWEPLFGHSSEMRDDPGGTIYPPMREVTSRYFERTDALLRALAETGDDALRAPSTFTPLVDRLPTAGALVDFMLGAHSMMHLGQVSAWRRMMGLGPCM